MGWERSSVTSPRWWRVLTTAGEDVENARRSETTPFDEGITFDVPVTDYVAYSATSSSAPAPPA
jgi:hypothetical protein